MYLEGPLPGVKLPLQQLQFHLSGRQAKATPAVESSATPTRDSVPALCARSQPTMPERTAEF